MKPINKKTLFSFWIIIWVIFTITILFFLEYKEMFSIFYNYSKEVNIDKNFISELPIEWRTTSNISGELNTTYNNIIRLEFPYSLIENKMLSISLKGTGTIQWYLVSNKPILNCNSWIINERWKCNNSYWIFDRVKNIYGLFQKTRIVKQPIVTINNHELFLEKNDEILWTISSELENYRDFSISSFMYSYMKKNTNMDMNFPTIDNPNWYSVVYLNPMKDNNIVFKPYDLQKDINKVGYIISLSWWTEIIYKFIENPLSKKDNEWLFNE